jgi:hypothetical protein
VNKRKEIVDAQAKVWNDWNHAHPHLMPGWKLEFIIRENQKLKIHVRRLERIMESTQYKWREAMETKP